MPISDSEPESNITPRKNTKKGTKKMTEYEKQRLERIQENKDRMKAMGLHKMASSLMDSLPVSDRKGKKKVGLVDEEDDDDDDEYMPYGNDDQESSGSDDEDDDDEYCVKPKSKKSTHSKKTSKLADSSGFVDEDEALMKAIALSLQDSRGFSDAADKTSPHISDAHASSAEKTERKQSLRMDDSGKRKRKLFTSRVQMTEDELILHFFQFDETCRGGINIRDLRRVAAAHDFTWKEEEMERMIHFFDSDGDGKLSLEDFTKIVQRCNMRERSENAERASQES